MGLPHPVPLSLHVERVNSPDTLFPPLSLSPIQGENPYSQLNIESDDDPFGFFNPPETFEADDPFWGELAREGLFVEDSHDPLAGIADFEAGGLSPPGPAVQEAPWSMRASPERDRQVGPWEALGLHRRPNWWHYWEERNLFPQEHKLVEEEPQEPSQVEQELADFSDAMSVDSNATEIYARSPKQEDPQPLARSPDELDEKHNAGPDGFTPPSATPPRTPPPSYQTDEEEMSLDDERPASESDADNPSPTWAAFFDSRQQRELSYYAAGPPREDFKAPPLRDGPWNLSSHVSTLLKKGFKISANLNMRGKAPPRLQLKSEQEERYISQMVEDGILVEAKPDFCVPHFFLYKANKLRLIFNGKRLNAAVARPPRFNMKSHKTIARYCAANSWHAADDLKNMFFSIKIAPASQSLFGLRTSSASYCYTSLPFGFSWSPFIAHIAVDQIAKRAIEAGHKVTHYLDDFHYFGNSKEEVEDARDFTRKLLDEANWRLNLTKEDKPSTRWKALGVEYDSARKSSRISHKIIAQLKEAFAHYARSKYVSRKTLASLVGLLVFLNNAVPGCLSQWGQLIDILQQPGTNWKHYFKFSALKPYIAAAISAAEATGWCPIQEFTAKPWEIFTDATPTQYGASWQPLDKARTCSKCPCNNKDPCSKCPCSKYPCSMELINIAKRAKKKQIYRAEADAIHWSLSKIRELKATIPKNILLRCDNMALVHAINKGRSNIFEANRVCQDILNLRLTGHIVKCKYINTLENPADIPSRAALALGRSSEWRSLFRPACLSE